MKTAFKKITTIAGVLSITITTSIGVSLSTPAPAHAATAEELVKFFGVLQRYITDLDKTMNPPPAAIPTNPQPDIPEPDTTEEVQSN
jgi:hypothetical protein